MPEAKLPSSGSEAVHPRSQSASSGAPGAHMSYTVFTEMTTTGLPRSAIAGGWLAGPPAEGRATAEHSVSTVQEPSAHSVSLGYSLVAHGLTTITCKGRRV